MENETIKQKIAKIMEIARRGGTEAEMLTAMAKAQELLLKHNISMSDVENLEIKDEDVIEEKEDGAPGQPWQRVVYNGIANLYFCEFYSETYNFLGKGRISYCVVGKESNAATVRLIANYLIQLGNELANKSGKDLPYRNSFKIGYSSRIYNRCMEEVRAATLKIEADNKLTLTAENKERGLLVVNPYAVTKKENRSFMDARGLKLVTRKRRRRAISSGEGYGAGQAAGNAVNLKSSATARIG